MNEQDVGLSAVILSIRVYKLLLAAYPSEFRGEYGPQMLQLFRDCSLRAYQTRGPSGMFSLWTITLYDYLSSVVTEHLQKETQMTKEKFIRLSGLALILAAITMVAGFGLGGGETAYDDPLGGRDGFYEYSQLILIPASMLFFTIGMIGLRIRYSKESGYLGKAGLSIAILGGGLAFLTSIPLFALWVVYEGAWWSTWIVSMATMYLGLLLFGIEALRKKLFPRWNGVPLLTGIWFPMLALISIIYERLGGNTETGGDILWLLAIVLVVAGTIVLGYLLQSDASERPLPAG